jgi:alpha-1,4-N-acetylglucosaminyltransferase EXTL2
MNGKRVRFYVPPQDSLNSRFEPLQYITTECVMILDDDMKVHLDDVANLYYTWMENRDQIVGVSPRWVDDKIDPSTLKYLYYSEDPPYRSDGSPDMSSAPRKGYSIMLTKAMMIHRDYLRLYTCGGNGIANKKLKVGRKFEAMRSTILDFVDKNFNCEDIGMNFVVAAALEHLHLPAPLYMEPVHVVGDFGKISAKHGTGLHQRQSHTSSRNTCLRLFNTEFKRVIGSNLPVQTREVRVTAQSKLGNFVYQGHRNRKHLDCINETIRDDACQWGY